MMDSLQHNFDDEARKIFSELNLSTGKISKYDPLNAIWRHPESSGVVYVGNNVMAKNEQELRKHNITHIVNCTDSLQNHHYGKDSFVYYRFLVSSWGTQMKSRDDEAILRFFEPVYEFIQSAVSQGNSVLIHCLAGAHRAGTTGVLYLMRRCSLRGPEATKQAQLCRPIINPIGRLKDYLVRYDRAMANKKQ